MADADPWVLIEKYKEQLTKLNLEYNLLVKRTNLDQITIGDISKSNAKLSEEVRTLRGSLES